MRIALLGDADLVTNGNEAAFSSLQSLAELDSNAAAVAHNTFLSHSHTLDEIVCPLSLLF